LSFNLDIILRVITAPNSAFAEIRDNEDKYFVPSVGLFLFTSALGALVLLPFVMIPFDDAYFEGVDDVDLPTGDADVVLFVGNSILSGFVSVVLFYFMGKNIGGNANWKKVFSVIFYTHVPAIPMTIIISILVFLMMGSFASIDSSYFMAPDGNEEKLLSVLGPILIYGGLIAIVGIVFVVWLFIVSVKAIKVVNGFGTGKAFGLLILVMIISTIVSALISS